jgi:protein-tyrosine phosphatase
MRTARFRFIMQEINVPTLYTISRSGAGRLSTMARPRGGDWLFDEFRDLAIAGVSVIVSMLTDAEAAELGLEREGDAAVAAGLEFLRLPTPDRCPPDPGTAATVARKLAGQLRGGASVAVHCRHAIRRSSTLAAAILVAEGLEPADAWTRIATTRAMPVPDTDAQREFIDQLMTFR